MFALHIRLLICAACLSVSSSNQSHSQASPNSFTSDATIVPEHNATATFPSLSNASVGNQNRNLYDLFMRKILRKKPTISKSPENDDDDDTDYGTELDESIDPSEMDCPHLPLQYLIDNLQDMRETRKKLRDAYVQMGLEYEVNHKDFINACAALQRLEYRISQRLDCITERYPWLHFFSKMNKIYFNDIIKPLKKALSVKRDTYSMEGIRIKGKSMNRMMRIYRGMLYLQEFTDKYEENIARSTLFWRSKYSEVGDPNG